MLVLSRKLGEKIHIGDGIVVAEIDRNKVRLAIQAPPGVPIFREEILPAGHPAALTPKEHPRCN